MDTVPGVDFGNLFGQFLFVALDEAAADDKLECVSRISTFTHFQINTFQNGVDAFLLGVADEAAGVDDDGVAVVALPVEVDSMPLCFQPCGEVLAVDGVLGAAEGDDVDFHGLFYSGYSAYSIYSIYSAYRL